MSRSTKTCFGTKLIYRHYSCDNGFFVKRILKSPLIIAKLLILLLDKITAISYNICCGLKKPIIR